MLMSEISHGAHRDHTSQLNEHDPLDQWAMFRIFHKGAAPAKPGSGAMPCRLRYQADAKALPIYGNEHQLLLPDKQIVQQCSTCCSMWSSI